MNNRRNSYPRYDLNRPVSLLIGGKGCAVFCELKDMSITGAKLGSVPLRYLPERFRILIDSENVALPCRLRWINGRQAGVEFIGEPDYQFNVFDENQITLT